MKSAMKSAIKSTMTSIMTSRKNQSFVSFAALTLSLLLLGFVSSEAQTWRSLSGANPYVHRIKVWQNPAVLIALADSAQPFNEDASSPLEFFSGEGYRVSTDDGASWSPSVLDGFSVRDLIRMPGDGQTWIAAVIKPFTFTSGTLRSTNSGVDWPTIADNDLLSIEQLLVRGTDTVEVYAGLFGTSQGFQVSRDSCRTFIDRSGLPISTRTIAISPLNDSLVIVGGDGRALPGVLHSTNLGVTWQKDTVGIGAKRILCVVPSKYYANVVYCGTDSITDNGVVGTGILKSNDTGSTWIPLPGSEGKRVWQIVEHPTNPAVLLAAADSAGIIASGNYGHGWEAANDGLPSGAVVRTLELVAGDMPPRAIAAYAGTYGHGVYKSSLIATGVEDFTPSNTRDMRIAPVPASDVATITVPFAHDQLLVLDITGRLVMSVEASSVDATQSVFPVNTSTLPTGTYRVLATANEKQSVGVLYIVR